MRSRTADRMTRAQAARWLLTSAVAALALASTAPRATASDGDRARIIVTLPAAAELAREDALRESQGEPWRFALPEAVQLTPDNSGTWEQAASGGRRWQLRISSPGALSLNLGFAQFWLPQGARLTVTPERGSQAPLAYDAADNADHGELWTPILLGDALLVELFVPAGARAPVLEMSAINSGYRFFGEDADDKSGACNIDVICPEGELWRNEIATVGLVSRQGSTVCSGALLNNTSGDGKPYFLTAYHCNVSAAAAPSVIIYWNYESPVCGQHGGGNLSQFTAGSTLRATWPNTDFTLIELSAPPNPLFGVKYAGWNRGGTLPSSAVGIHHPDVDEKSISFENDPLRLTEYVGTVEPGDGTHLRVVDWDVGTTEGGSSGSPLFDEGHRVVGQLHGGFAACGNNLSDWYGWFNVSWEGGGTAGSRLRDWLDPIASGAVTIDLLDPASGIFAVTPAGGITVSGRAAGPFTPLTSTLVLVNSGDTPATFATATDQTWLAASPTSGVVPAYGEVSVEVTLTAAALTLAPGRHTGNVTISNTSRGGAEVRGVALDVIPSAPTFVALGPNPFQDFVNFRLSLPTAMDMTWRVFDLRGRLVNGPTAQAGALGENTVVWDGRGAGGRRLPSGMYVLAVEAGGTELRSGVVWWR